MNSFNSIIIEGNLVKDPVASTTPKGTAVCRFSMASNRFYRGENETQKEVSFFDVEVWNRLAENCNEYLKKGRGVRVVGRLKQDRWTDQDGKMHSRIKIVGEQVEFKPLFNQGSKEQGAQVQPQPQGDKRRYSSSRDLSIAEPEIEYQDDVWVTDEAEEVEEHMIFV